MLIVLDPAGAEGDLRASEICCLGCPMISGHEFWVFQAASWGLLWRSRISCGVLYPNPE